VSPAFGLTVMSSASMYYANKFQLLGLVLLNALCGVYVSWNVSLQHGLGYEMVTNFILGLAVLIYNCCVSELSSTFPFPGGSYGMARCTLGFYPGYLVGCCEIFYSIMSFSYSNIAMVFILITYYPQLTPFALLILILMIALQFAICGASRRVFWTSIALFASFMFLFNFSYAFGCLQFVDFNRYAYSYIDDVSHERKSLFIGNGFSALKNISSLIWCYAGPEFVNLTCDDVVRPRRQIPFAQVLGIVIIFIHNTIVAFVCSSISPGTEVDSVQFLPLAPGKPIIYGDNTEFNASV
jgi:ethanolamine permease